MGARGNNEGEFTGKIRAVRVKGGFVGDAMIGAKKKKKKKKNQGVKHIRVHGFTTLIKWGRNKGVVEGLTR